MSSEMLPLSFPQQAVFLDAQLHGPSSKYTMGGGSFMRGPLDPELFRQALAFAFRHHDALRLRMRMAGDEVGQVLLEDAELPFEFMDFSDRVEPAAAAGAWIQDNLAQAWDVEAFPLFHDVLFRLGDDLHLWYPRFHHVANDAYGHLVQAETVSAAYNSLLSEGRLPELPRRSYLDFIQDNLAYGASARFQEDRRFWEEKFAFMPEPLPFTTRKGSLVQDRFQTQRCTLSLNRLVYDAFLRLCEEEGLTPFPLLLAVAAIYLHRVYGRRDLVIGTPIHNRSNRVFRETVGMFMNMMPVRIAVEPGDTLLGLARRVAAELKTCFRHQRFPFGEMVRHCRTLEGFCQGVFDVTLVYRKLDYGLAFGEVQGRMLQLESGLQNESLSFAVDEFSVDEDVHFHFNYNPQLISSGEAAQMAGAFERILIDAVVVGDQAVAELRLGIEAAPRAAEAEAPSEQTVLDLFHHHAGARPLAPALVDGETRLTYGALAAMSDRVASFLVRQGLEREQPVAVLAQRGAAWVAALLGIMKAGGAYLPLDPEAPRERLALILEDSACPLLLVGEGLDGQGLGGARVVALAEALAEPVLEAAPAVGIRSLAYIIYTSGTSGRPNGVLVEHGGLANTALGQIRGWDLGPADGMLQFSAPMFDASLAEVFGALASGARLVIAGQAVIQDPAGFPAFLSQEQVTVAVLPPTYLSALGRVALPSLRIVGSAGAAANPADAAHYNRTQAFVNAYGPTEGSICSTFMKLEAASGFAGERVPIGRPLPHTEILLLDEQLQPVPAGAAGELCLGGVNVARGYLNRPELTRQRFLPHPFREGERIYRTGDLAMLLPDGTYEFLGRRDLQVKVRGYRIEPGEIEAVLQCHEAVETAAVTGLPEGELAAYIVPRGPFDPGQLRRFLASRLPAYMVPSRWVALGALPLNASGKVDLGALPAPPPAEVQADEAPATPLERRIAALWEEELDCGAVSRRSDFFELGGHSLKAFAILGRIRRELGVRLPMSEFFEGPTVERLAALLEARSRPAPEAAPAEAKAGALSSLQERLWLVHRLDPANAAYSMPWHLRFHGPVDIERLVEALRRLWRRHEALRSIYPSVGGVPARTVLAGDLEVPVHRLEEGAWEAHYLAHHAAPFDLERGPLMRACIYGLGPQACVLLVDIHHLNGDAVSLEILREDLFELYQALVEGREPALADPGAPYGDFVAEEEAWQASPAFTPALERRVRELAGAPTRLGFLFDGPLEAAFGHRGRSLTRVAEDLGPYHRAFARGRAAGLSPFMVVLAAFGTLLHLQTGQEDILVGVPTSLRDDDRFARTVGFFVNTCVVRLDFAGAPTLTEILRRTAKAVGDMLHCPQVPLDRLVRTLQDQRSPDRPPLVQAALSFLQDDGTPPAAPAGLAVEPVLVARDSAMFELTLDLVLQGGRGLCNLEYRADGWQEPTVQRMLDQFHRVLEAMATRPEAVPAEIAASDFLEGAPLESATRTVPEAVLSHAASRPEATALLWEGGSATYGELEAEIALARGQVAGLPPGAALGIALAPGLRWTALALAAMAEGRVVVPLDPRAPAERLQAILEDAGAVLAGEEPAPPRRGPVRARPEDTAYILYTSGTTGRPKGVRVSHGAFEAHCRSALAAFGLDGADRGLVFAPGHFDASWEQLFAPLVAGGSVLVRGAELWAPEVWCRRLEEARVTFADVPPQYLRELLFFLEKRPECAPAALRMLLTGGEALPTAVAQAWLAGPLAHLPLFNVYGPTEGVVTATFHRVAPGARIATAGGVVPIGLPMPGRVLAILDGQGRPVAPGGAGELCLGGPCLAEGYQGGRELEAWTQPRRLYRTGDRVRLGPDGTVEFLGRLDRQVKVRGFRIEPGEIEARLILHPAIAQARVVGRQGSHLVAYCIPRGPERPEPRELATWLGSWLPEYMIPAATVFLEAFPTTSTGKIDEAALPEPVAEAAPAAAKDGLEARVAAIWAEALGRTDVGLHANFFDLGGHSLLLVRVHTRLEAELGMPVRLVDLFAHPTVARMAALLRGEAPRAAARFQRTERGDIAVIGMAGRFPGASTVEELWANLAAGRESIRFFSAADLEAAGVPAAVRDLPAYVPAHGVLEDALGFDAPFFGYTPREASLVDPQQRLFLEEAWHALEDAGCDPARHPGDIAVFAGVGMNQYLLDNLAPLLRNNRSLEAFSLSLGNDKDFVTTRASYKLDLRGPSVNVNTACSTSLVAIHLAAEALQRGECDMALAGGVTLHLPPGAGYLYQPGGIASPDGHCRAFAEEASGTTGGSGGAVVVLKRLDQALADGDTVRAVIRGSAINNDGADKVGFTAPGVNRQRDVIRAALDRSGVGADTIGYVEAHGTGTVMGDPIEVQALCQAFAPDRPAPQSCLLGSIKSNLGHLDAAAGVAGFIKAALALEHGQVPPSLHCARPSTRIGFPQTPFRVPQALEPWPGAGPRRAGVSSFGIGGTNAHVVLEAAPETPALCRQDTWCIPLSARSGSSLRASAERFARHLEEHPGVDAVDLWFTLSEGRRRFPVRAVVLAASRPEAVAALRALEPGEIRGQGALAFAQAFLAGEETSALLPPGPRRRIPLPGYAFEHELYWSEAPAPEPEAPARLPLEAWLHFPSWERLPLLPSRAPEPVLVLHGGSALEGRWLDALRAGGIPTTVRKTGRGLDPTPLAQCWHLGALGATGDEAQRLDALLADVRALVAARDGQPTTLLLLAPGPDPEFAYLDAVRAVLPFEHPSLTVKVLQVDPGALDPRALDHRLLACLQAAGLPGEDRSLALWGGALWRRTHRPLSAAEAPLREGGSYLVTGGLGGVGLALATHLARACKARLALVSRSAPDAAQAEAIRALEAAGAQVRVAALDVAEAGPLKAFLDELGPLDGVIHAAGVPGGSLAARTGLEEIRRVLRAKVEGTRALAAALEGREPGFVLLCSSLTASLGGPGQVAYAAANAWMDAFAAQRRQGRWISVQWDSWAEVGMAARARPVSPARTPVREWRLSPEYWPWGEHRIQDLPTLPGTAYLELFAQALGGAPCELGSVALMEPMIHGGEDSRLVQVLREGEDLVLQSATAAGLREHARARHRTCAAPPALEPLEAVRDRCPAAPDALKEAGIAIQAGPRWDLAGDFRLGQGEALARLELAAPFHGDLEAHPFHPALLDVGLSHYIAHLEGGTQLMPWRYERVSLHAPLTPVLYSHLRLRSAGERSVVLDADLRDAAGRLLVQVEGYTLLRVAEAPRAAEPAANPFALTPAEGVATFLRILATAEPVVCVSTVPWERAARSGPAVQAAQAPAARAALRPRPELATPYRAPETEGERLMAGVWQEVLGYDLGLDDDLFDLGADSLTALQASARLRELTGVELAMDRFFAKATVANLARDLGGKAEPVAAGAWEEGEL